MPELIPGFGMLTQGAVILLAFSFLVFIHELGHYAAARLVGVRVESFYIGIPIYDMALRVRRGSTIYGIGLLPLGGFVKLTGQSDDPRGMGRTDDPGDLNAKPLWARALVFVSGVVMNLFFGFLLLVWANMHGIPFVPAVLGELDPTGAAAVHGLREGDRVTAVDGRPVRSFEDLAGAIAIAGKRDERIIDIERPLPDGARLPMSFKVLGQESRALRGNLVSLGADAEWSNRVAGLVDHLDFSEVAAKLRPGDRIIAVAGAPITDNQGREAARLAAQWPENRIRLDILRAETNEPVSVEIPLETYGNWDLGVRHALIVGRTRPGSAAEAAGLKAGDAIVAMAAGDGAPERFRFGTDHFAALVRQSARRPVRLTVERGGERLEVSIRPQATPGSTRFGAAGETWLGASLESKPAAAPGGGPARWVVSDVFPGGAAEGLLTPGDALLAVNGEPMDPAQAPGEAIRAAGTAELTLYVKRGDGEGGVGVDDDDLPYDDLALLDPVKLRTRFDPETRQPMIGIEYHVGPAVSVEPGSAAAARLGTETSLLGARIAGMYLSPDLKVTTLVAAYRGDVGGGVLLATPDWVLADPAAAGLKRRLPFQFQTARDTRPLALGPALAMSGRQWCDLSLTIYRTLGKLVTREVPLKAMGGPVQLFRIIKVADDRGFGYLLYVVALISINLGICNLLPFPVLDGGHLMFLAYEAAFRRKPGETFLVAAQYAGLACLLAVMLTVTGYDLADWLGL